MNGKNKPPRIALTFFNWFCHPDFREEIEGDLMERFNTYIDIYGRDKANELFVKDVLFLFRPSLIGNFYHLTNTNTMVVSRENKRLVSIITAAIALLLIPLIAMNFTNDVNWELFDFIVAGVLLIGAGLGAELILRKIITPKNRILLFLVLILALFLLWAELAVGIFGTAIAGS